MSDSTPRLGLPDLPDTPELYADTVSDAFWRLDAFADLYLKGQFVNDPPASPGDGDAWLTGGAPTGAWNGYAYKIAACRDGGWQMLTPFNGLRAFVESRNGFIVYQNGAWLDCNALVDAAEASIASAASCDIGAANALLVAVTGTTAITGFGAATNRLRFLRFADVLTLTHDATSLALPGAADIVTAAGDTAIFASDGSGNWRCHNYQRAHGAAARASGVTGSGNAVLSDSAVLTGLTGFAGNLAVSSGKALAFYNTIDQAVNFEALQLLWNANIATIRTAHGGTGAGRRIQMSGPNGDIVIDSGGNSTGNIRVAAATTNSNVPAFGVAATLNSSTGNQTGLLINPVMSQTGTGGYTALYVNPAETGFTGSGPAKLLDLAVAGTSKFSVSNAGVVTMAGAAGIAMAPAGAALCAYQASSAAAAGLLRVQNTASALLALQYQTGDVGSITTNGTAASYNTTSDARLKRVAPRQTDYRRAIRALWVGDFTWRESGAPGFGVLAQQAYEAMPNHQGVTRPENADDAWQASAEPFAHLALWGVKDLYALIENLTRRITMLEAAYAAG